MEGSLYFPQRLLMNTLLFRGNQRQELPCFSLHVADFHYMDDARDIWNAVKARFGGNAESKKMRKSMLKQEFSKFRISEAEGLYKGYDRMQKILIALTLKTKGGLELLSFDNLYYKLKTLEVDIKGYSTFSSSQSAGPSHSAFFSTTSASKKMSYLDSPCYSSSTYTALSNSKTGSYRSARKARRKIDFDKKESARFNKKKVRCYKCLQRGHFARECRAKGGNDKQRYSSFKIQEIGKKEEDSKALITVDTLVDWTDHDGQSNGVIASKEFGMIAGCDTEDAIKEGAAKIYNLITGANTKEVSTAGDAGEFALMGVTSEVHNCPFGCDNKYNELQKQYNELNAQHSEYFIQVQAYKNSLKTLEKQKRVLQKNQLTLEDKIRVLSIELENTTNLLKHSKRINAIAETAKKDLQTKLDNHLAQTEKWRTSSKNLFRLVDSSMSVRTKVGLGFNNYIGENELGWDESSFSVFTTNSEEVEDHTDLDESHMSYGTKSSTSGDSNSVSNDFVSCDNNDNISASESEAKIESFAGTPIQEPIIVQDLPSFSCNNSNKNENTSRTSCNKNGYFNKKAGHFRKNNSSTSKSCFDNATRVTQSNHFVPQTVLFRSGKVSIPAARPNQVSTGRPKPVSTGRPKPVFYWEMSWEDGVVIRRSDVGENPYSDAEDEGIFDMVVLKYMDSNMERLDDFPNSRISRRFVTRRIRVLFTDTDCLVLSKDFMLPDESMVLLRVPRKNNLYTINLNNLSPKGNLAYLMEKALVDESVQWHWRMGHVKAIRCDNGTEFKNAHIIELCGSKGIKRDYSNARTPQQNGVAERKNRTLIEAARTMLADSKLPTMFWTEVVDEGYIVGYSASNRAYRVYNVHNKRVEETMNLRYLEEKPNVQDSECDEQVIIIPSYPSHNLQEAEPKDTSSDAGDDSSHDSAEEIFQQELARLKDPTGGVLVPTGSPTDSFFNNEPATRFPSPSDLGNNEPSLGIFSSSSYDDEFGADLNNLAAIVERGKTRSKMKPRTVAQALEDPSWVDAMQDEMQSMIGSLMYLTASRPDIMFAVSACSRNQVTPTTSNLEAVKKIFKYLKDYAGANKDRKSTTGGCQFLGRRSPELGPPAILATIDATPYTITEDSVRGQLQLADDGGIDDLPIADIYSGMDNLGYVTEGKLTFYKNKFSPQWRFLVHTILHCLSTKSRSWDQFGSLIAVALIFLSDRRKFNWSSYIFKGMVSNIGPRELMINLTPLLFYSTSTNVEDEPLGGSFHASPPRSTLASLAGHTSGGAEDPITLTALSAVVSTLVQKVHSLETELKAHKQLFKDVESKMWIWMLTHALANAAVTVDSTKSPGGPSSNPAACSNDPTSDGPTTIRSYKWNTTYPTISSIPAAEPIPARSGSTTATPSSPVRDARKGKCVAIEEPTPTQDKTFKQLEEERTRLWRLLNLQAQELANLEKQRAESLMKDANLARQICCLGYNFGRRLSMQNPYLSSTIFGVDFTNDDFATRMVALVNSRRKELAEQRA
ncbi:putative ribonuclease H-like domain-containing protein [Tanacetum coccineum]